MRIALVNLSLERGRGSDIVVADLATRLCERHDVTVYTLRGVPDETWPFRVVAPASLNGRLGQLSLAVAILRRISREARHYDVINSHHALISLFLPKARLITTYHGYRGRLNLVLGEKVGGAISWLVRRFPVRAALRRSRGATVVSASLAEEAERSGCRDWRVIYNGVEKFPDLAPMEPSHFLYLGRIDPDKSVGKLLDAFEKANVAAPLLLVGDGSERRRLEARYSGGKIRFVGTLPREQLPGLFAGAYAIVTASEFETFCLPIIEAAQFGCPAVGPASGSLPEVIRQGITGELAQPGQLTAAIEAIWKQTPEARKGMQMACREWARNFSWETSLQAYETLYASIRIAGA